MSAAPALARTTQAKPAPDPRRWVALGFIAVAQLMIALDATIVSIALPSAQRALGASDADRQWVVTAYTLAFAGLLLLGGRIADHLGRKRAFVAGLAGFALASVLGGAAPNFGVLIGARALQGAFAALLAPTALSLVAVTFTEARERATAFVVYGSIAGTGAAAGLLLGGVLTQYLEWRWCLYVNAPIAIAAAAGAAWVLPRAQRMGSAPALDIAGAVLATAGLVALVYAGTEVARSGRLSAPAVLLLAASAALLVLFVLRQARTSSPLLPLRLLLDRNRGGAFATVTLVMAGMFGAYLFLTYYLQAVLHYTPLKAGIAFLPITVASQSAAWLIARRLMPHVAPRALIAPGVLVAAAGMALLTQLHVDSSYWLLVLPAELLLGMGLSTAMSSAFSMATRNVDQREAGIASAAVNAGGQVGASLGTALLNTIATTATAAHGGAHGTALVHGFAVATGWGAAIMVAGAVVAAGLIDAGRPAGARAPGA